MIEVHERKTRLGATVYALFDRCAPSRRCPEGALVAVVEGDPRYPVRELNTARGLRYATRAEAAAAIPRILRYRARLMRVRAAL